MLWTYTPEDPGWMVATDEPAQNALGRFGAAVASTLIIICGKGAWGIPLILLAWGVRFVHASRRGPGAGADDLCGDRAWPSPRSLRRRMCRGWTGRIPSAWAGCSATRSSGRCWGSCRCGAGLGLKLLSLCSGVALVAMGLFVTGFDMAELRRLARFLLLGLVMSYAWIATMLGRGRRGAARAAQAARGSPGRAARGCGLSQPTMAESPD